MWPMIESALAYDFPELRVSLYRSDSETEPISQHLSRWAFVTNIPRYAGGLTFSPAAKPWDSLLDLCAFQRGFWAGLSYFWNVQTGRHTTDPLTVHAQSAKIRIEMAQTNSPPVPYQLDGDPGGELPVEIGCLPGRLSFIVSPAWLARIPMPLVSA
jgi:diacylglycerol kinase (ATP)